MSSFHLQIVTPDGEFFDGPAQRVKVRTINGDVAILDRHIPYVTALGIGEAAVTMEDGTVHKAAASGGMLSVTPEIVRVVATTFEWAEDIDLDRAQRAKETAEERIKKAQDAKELELAKAKLSRALVRLKVGQ
ncbi:MAG: ATP synthase F1 subunit epsilon [Oscillospiraceae bacterium]|nr:ATP synthase F1 subunit epsilon [Oscillospiraceae bacterium]